MKTRVPIIAILIGILLIPLFQQIFKPIPIYRLKGHYEVYPLKKVQL